MLTLKILLLAIFVNCNLARLWNPPSFWHAQPCFAIWSLLAILQLHVGPQNRVVSDTYDAETETSESRDSDETETSEWRDRDKIETSVPLVRDDTETRRSKQCLETFGRDVRVVTVQLIGLMCRPISTLLWVCIHFVKMCFNRPQCWWFKVQTRQAQHVPCGICYSRPISVVWLFWNLNFCL